MKIRNNFRQEDLLTTTKVSHHCQSQPGLIRSTHSLSSDYADKGHDPKLKERCHLPSKRKTFFPQFSNARGQLLDKLIFNIWLKYYAFGVYKFMRILKSY